MEALFEDEAVIPLRHHTSEMASSCPDFDSDLAMALELQWRMDAEEAAAQANANAEVAELLPPEWRTPGKGEGVTEC